MAFILSQGLETNANLEARLGFLADHTSLWIGGWLTWNAAALSILYFYAAFALAHAADGKTSAAVLIIAVLLGAIGVAADLAAEAIEMGTLPGLARHALTQTVQSAAWMTARSAFLVLDRTAVVLTGYLANGLYTCAALLLIASTRPAYPRWVWMAGLGAGASGLALSGVSLAHSVAGMYWANMALVPCLILWQLGVALTADRRGKCQ